MYIRSNYQENSYSSRAFPIFCGGLDIIEKLIWLLVFFKFALALELNIVMSLRIKFPMHPNPPPQLKRAPVKMVPSNLWTFVGQQSYSVFVVYYLTECFEVRPAACHIKFKTPAKHLISILFMLTQKLLLAAVRKTSFSSIVSKNFP